MPNHVINEVVFSNISPDRAARVLGLVRNQQMGVDFGILLPVPLNCWMGCVGSEHKMKFPNNALDWCSENWSTKWNAYGEQFFDYKDAELTIRFKTAWNAPRGWLCALFNSSKLSFRYAYLSEGENDGHIGVFNIAEMDKMFGEAWKETVASQVETDRLGGLLWGEQAYAEIKGEPAEEDVPNGN